jgi:putative membrane protein
VLTGFKYALFFDGLVTKLSAVLLHIFENFMKKLRQSGVLAAKGFCMGVADVIPGVSGGTMALILGIYQAWLAAIRSFDLAWLRACLRFDGHTMVHRPHFGFIIPVALGVFAALLFFTRVVPLPVLLHTHPEAIYGLFFGLIGGSIISLTRTTGAWQWNALPFLIGGTVLGWLIVNLVPMDTPDSAWFIFLSGFIAICAMLLPGISGSFILLILHKYDTVMSAIGHFNFAIIIPFGAGALAGFVVFSRVFSWLLERFHRPALLTIIGLLIGALWIIWPFQVREYVEVRDKLRLISSQPVWPDSFSAPVMISIVMMVVGLALVLILEYLAQRRH